MTKKKDRSGKRRDSEKKKRPFSKKYPRATGLLLDALCLGTIALATVLVYHRATQYFFSQDDFTSLWIAREAPKTFWRILSSFVYFRAASSLFGLNPVAFHVVSLLLHIVNALLVFLIAKALSAGRMTSLVAAVLFAVHPSLYVAIYAISSIGEILSCLFVLLAALYLLRTRKPESLAALPLVCLLFIASLLSKETTIAFPALAALVFLARNVKLKRTIPVLAALVGVAVVYGILFYSADIFGIRETFSKFLGAKETSAQGGAYATTLGPTLVMSLQTYLKWTFYIVESWYHDPGNLLDRSALPWLFGGIGFLLLLVFSSGSNRWKSAFCVLWLLLMLVPVIPLATHAYHYYLYIPLAGFSPALGIFLSERLRKSQWKTLASACLIVLLSVNSGALMQKMETATFGHSRMKADAVFDRAIVSKNLIADLRKRELPRGAKLLMVSPLKEIREGTIIENPDLVMGGSYWDSNVRCAVAEGLGIRLFFPQVDTVVFVAEVGPAFEDFCVLPYRWDGHLREIEPALYWTEVGMHSLDENPSFAIRCFENAVNSDSLYTEAFYYLARTYLSEAQLGPAAKVLRRYVALLPAGVPRDQALEILRSLTAQGY